MHFPDVEIGKILSLGNNWKYSDLRITETPIGMAVGTVTVNADEFLNLRVGYSLVEHPELLSKIAPDIFVKLQSNKAALEDAICEPISKMASLVDLTLEDTEITDKGASKLASLHNLRALVLSKTAINGSCLPALSTMKSLRCLSLDSDIILPENIKFFADLPPLTFLSVGKCGLNDQALKYITQIKSLETLKLFDNPQITNKGLALLRNLKNLRGLYLDDPRLTMQALEQLKGLPLHYLALPKNFVDLNSDALRAAFPQAKIIARHSHNVTPDVKFLYAPLH